MSTNHTPGPWTGHTFNGSKFGLIVNHELQQPIANIEPDLTEETEANINLIAAAPDLLEALEALMETRFGGLPSSEVLELAGAAIAKARGI
jgi:hypothetical protein